jgi:hypothetical protein
MSERAPIFILGKSSPLEPPTYRPVISGGGARAYYRLGYYHAALDLARQLVQGKGQLSSAMPVLFLFRHYLELAMKDVFEAAGAFDIQQSDCLFGHDLEKLLLELRKVADSYDLSCGEELDEVALTILEIHSVDQGATAFRYAMRCDGDPQFEKHGVVDFQRSWCGWHRPLISLSTCLTTWWKRSAAWTRQSATRLLATSHRRG